MKDRPHAPLPRAGARGATAAAGPTAAGRSANDTEADDQVSSAQRPHELVGVRQSSPPVTDIVSSPGRHGALFDNLSAAAGRPYFRSVAVASASAGRSDGRVAAGLVNEARRRGLRAATARIARSRGRSVLAVSEGTRSRRKGDGSNMLMPVLELSNVDLGREHGEPSLVPWLRAVLMRFDVLVVTGPPLSDFIDIAAVAKECDGLAIVVEGDSTTYDDLQLARETAHAAGCQLLGVVVSVARRRLRRWSAAARWRKQRR